MIKALIFDLDGTVANTEQHHYLAWQQTLLANGVEQFSEETFLRYVGTSNEKVAGDYIELAMIPRTVAELVLLKQQVYMELLADIELCDGVVEILNAYDKRMKMALATSSHTREARAILELNGLLGHFHEVVGGDTVIHKKPDPEIYLKTQRLLGVTPEQSVAFEDSGPGVQSAKNAGMFCIAIPNAYTISHDFSRADCVVDSLRQVNDELLARLK